MKTYMLLIGLSVCFLLHAQESKTVANTAGNLSTLLTSDELNTVAHLTITGTLDANDIALINTAMPALTSLDISHATIEPCLIPTVDSFEANWFPGPSLSKNSLNYGGLNKPLLTSIQLPLSLEVLGSSALEYSGITAVSIPPTVTSIGWSAFARSALTSVTLPSSVTYLNEWIFDGCNALNEVVIESALTTIPRGTFAGCSSLSSVNIPSTVSSIQMSAFLYCSSLTTLTLPEEVSSIEANAFFGCSGLTTIYSYNPVPPLTQSSFSGVDKTNCIVYVPAGSGELYAAASEWQEFTHIVEAPGLTLSSNTVALGPENNSSATIRLHSKSTWTITSNQSWLTIYPATGNNNETITFTAQANPLYTSRTAIVTVSTNDGYSETVTVTQSARTNTAPVANAGNDLTVLEGETVQLDGSSSSDADNDALSYHWYAPEGIELSSNTIARPAFTAPQVNSQAEITLILVVNDGINQSAEDRVVITILNQVELSVSDHSVTLGAANNSSATVDLYCNSSWEATADQNWLTISPSSESGNHVLTFSAQANPNYSTRSATVTVTATGNVTETITVVQQARSNSAPVANAGLDQTVDEGEMVQLNGSASTDPDGNELTYRWIAPEGITLSSNTSARPTFTAPQVDRNTAFTFTLTVNDGMTNSPENQVVITVRNQIELSVSDHTISLGADENLSASVDLYCNSSWEASSDHSWLTITPTSGNGNHLLTLTAQANPLPESRSAEVTVSASGNLTETITISQSGKANSVPVANAGLDQTVDEGETVQLDGSASSDPDNNELIYHWTAPEGITLSSITAARPTFTAPQVNSNTEYIFSLVVDDGTTDSPADRVTITIVDLPELSVSEKSVILGAANNSSASVTIRCNAAWNATCHHDWLAISPESSNGDQVLTITAQANPLNTARSAEVIVSASPDLSETITVTQQALVNTAPVANAGNDRMVNAGELVQLDGSASTDIDNDALTYLWTAPAGVVLSSVTDARPTFTAPPTEVETSYTFSLVVNDGQVSSAADQVIITVTNQVVELNLSATSIAFDTRLSTARIILSANAPWTATSDQLWLSVTPASGSGDQILVITAQANPTVFERTGTITISAPGAESVTFVVTQAANPVGTEETTARAQVRYFPNPFTQELAVEIANPSHKEVSVEIYTITGQRIKSLASKRNDEYISITWNGTNEPGQTVPHGMYILKINEEALQVVFKGR